MTSPLEQFAAPGTLRPGLWRLVVGVAIILLIWVLWTAAVLAAVALVNLASGMSVDDALTAMQAQIGSGEPLGVILTLLTFAGIWPGTWAALRLMHAQRFATLLSPTGLMRWSEFGTGLLLAVGFWLLTLAFGMALAGAPARSDLPLGLWLAALSPLAVLVFFQASGEELIFRGYILQQLASRYRSPMIWAFLPSFLFGLLHYSGGAGLGIGWHYVAVTTLFGLAAAAMVWRTGSLALAMGMHTGMNMFSLSVVGIDGIIDGTQLFIYDGASARVLFLTDGTATAILLAFVLSPYFPLGRRATA
ncbi:MAG TPA: type II CAAX endopeptidase family protein [Thermohalobaculum sp.]|nr:type II CAAX endopeptidase family protein [Thermohalobaculum sp.]